MGSGFVFYSSFFFFSLRMLRDSEVGRVDLVSLDLLYFFYLEVKFLNNKI